jgi:hypothetical protein
MVNSLVLPQADSRMALLSPAFAAAPLGRYLSFSLAFFGFRCLGHVLYVKIFEYEDLSIGINDLPARFMGKIMSNIGGISMAPCYFVG